MDAWESLLTNSSITSGDAWEHLQNQEGGGTGEPYAVLVTDMEIEVDMLDYELEMESVDEVVVEVDIASFEIEIEDNNYTLEVEL